MIEQAVRIEIRRLRATGMSYAAICDQLGQAFPKSTLSYVCKGVDLPDEYLNKRTAQLRDRLQLARGKALIVNKDKLKNRYDQIQKQAAAVVHSKEGQSYEKVSLAMLYLAEGSKYKSYRGLAMGSSDPDILRIYISLLERCYGKKRSDFRARVQHRDDQDQEGLKEYWAKNLQLLPEAFYSSYSDKRTIGKPTRSTEYKGVCVISCGGADIQLELDAIARLYEQKIWGVSSFG